MTTADLEQVHSRLNQLLADAGAKPLDGLYVCPHGLGVCACRKPLPGLLLQALAEHDGCAGESFMVGDSDSDIEAARASGVIAVRIGGERDPRAAFTAPDLAHAAQWMASRGSGLESEFA
jgi:D-glycero-D-manno-heptose 1,7-bisphosphate phosphatase